MTTDPVEPSSGATDLATAPRRKRQNRTQDRMTSDEPPEIVPEIHSFQGADSVRLAMLQARVITEVTEWMLHHRSEPGIDRAA